MNTQKRSCDVCRVKAVCSVYWGVFDTVRGRTNINLKSESTSEQPLPFTAIFESLAGCCNLFEFRKVEE
ncbi:MAG: hypothetical protein AAF806_26425 [Bacteroidota bacterium]